jgi:hypothetical protein
VSSEKRNNLKKTIKREWAGRVGCCNRKEREENQKEKAEPPSKPTQRLSKNVR